MLKKVKIKNFLSCQDVELELNDVTALIGRNAAGKTNILRVIEERAQFAVGAKSLPSMWFNSHPRKEVSSECTFEFSIEAGLFKYEINISRVGLGGRSSIIVEKLWRYDDNDWQVIAEKNNEIAVFHYADEVIEFKISASAPVIHAIRSLLPEEQLSSNITPVFNYLSKVIYYDFDNKRTKEFSSLSDDRYQQWLAENKKIELSVCMRLLHLWHSDKETFEEVKALLGENGLNLIKNIVINPLYIESNYDGEPPDTLYRISFTSVTRNDTLDYSELSFGTQRVLAIVLALLYDDNSTLLIEQPEDGIHVSLLRKVLSLCFTYAEYLNKQLLIATHSAEIIDLLQAEDIRFIKMTDEGTKASKLSDEEMALVPDYIRNEGSLSEFIDTVSDE